MQTRRALHVPGRGRFELHGRLKGGLRAGWLTMNVKTQQCFLVHGLGRHGRSPGLSRFRGGLVLSPRSLGGARRQRAPAVLPGQHESGNHVAGLGCYCGKQEHRPRAHLPPPPTPTTPAPRPAGHWQVRPAGFRAYDPPREAESRWPGTERAHCGAGHRRPRPRPTRSAHAARRSLLDTRTGRR